MYNGQVQFEQKKIKSEAKNRKSWMKIEEANNIQLPKHLQRAKELGSEKGASNWLTTLPIEAHGFALMYMYSATGVSSVYGEYNIENCNMRGQTVCQPCTRQGPGVHSVMSTMLVH